MNEAMDNPQLCPVCFTPINLEQPDALVIVGDESGEVVETREYFICDCGSVNIRIMSRRDHVSELETMPANPTLN